MGLMSYDCTIASTLLRQRGAPSAPCGSAFLASPALLSRRGCFPADGVRRLADGTLELSRGKIVVRVTRTFPIEASPDGRPHFCMGRAGLVSRRAACSFRLTRDYFPELTPPRSSAPARDAWRKLAGQHPVGGAPTVTPPGGRPRTPPEGQTENSRSPGYPCALRLQRKPRQS
jgi:hypothetical protein